MTLCKSERHEVSWVNGAVRRPQRQSWSWLRVCVFVCRQLYILKINVQCLLLHSIQCDPDLLPYTGGIDAPPLESRWICGCRESSALQFPGLVITSTWASSEFSWGLCSYSVATTLQESPSFPWRGPHGQKLTSSINSRPQESASIEVGLPAPLSCPSWHDMEQKWAALPKPWQISNS